MNVKHSDSSPPTSSPLVPPVPGALQGESSHGLRNVIRGPRDPQVPPSFSYLQPQNSLRIGPRTTRTHTRVMMVVALPWLAQVAMHWAAMRWGGPRSRRFTAPCSDGRFVGWSSLDRSVDRSRSREGTNPRVQASRCRRKKVVGITQFSLRCVVLRCVQLRETITEPSIESASNLALECRAHTLFVILHLPVSTPRTPTTTLNVPLEPVFLAVVPLR